MTKEQFTKRFLNDAGLFRSYYLAKKAYSLGLTDTNKDRIVRVCGGYKLMSTAERDWFFKG